MWFDVVNTADVVIGHTMMYCAVVDRRISFLMWTFNQVSVRLRFMTSWGMHRAAEMSWTVCSVEFSLRVVKKVVL